MPKVIAANGIRIKPVDWLWNGRIPLGCITILEGDPGVSKSTIAMTMAAHVTMGTMWPDGEVCPIGSVIVANAEDPEDSVVTPRLIAAGATLSKVHVIVPSGGLFQIPENVPEITQLVKDEGVKLIVFDPLEAYLSMKVNTIGNKEIRHAFQSLEDLAKRTNCAVVIVRHLNKDAGKPAIYRGGGSIAVIAAARSSILVAEDPSDKDLKVMVRNKGNWAAPKPGLRYRTVEVKILSTEGEVTTTQIKWEGDVKSTAGAILSSNVDVETQSAIADASEWIKGFLANGEAPMNEVMKDGSRAGFERRIMFRAAKLLGVEWKQDLKGWIWSIQ